MSNCMQTLTNKKGLHVTEALDSHLWELTGSNRRPSACKAKNILQQQLTTDNNGQLASLSGFIQKPAWNDFSRYLPLFIKKLCQIYAKEILADD